MSQKEPNPHAVPPKQIVIISVVVFIGICFGSWLALKKADADMKRRFSPPKGMGHVAPVKTLANTNLMAWIPAGTFAMGSTNGAEDEAPIHNVTLDGFWMDKYEVSNEEFARFVKATGYVTTAEKKPDPALFPGADPALLVPGSIIFSPPHESMTPEQLRNPAYHALWWKYEPGASWRHPEGPASDLKGREKHPVTHVSWDDAVAYAGWSGKRLPTEAEWEYAARGGLVQKPYVWGDEPKETGPAKANLWQGNFPIENLEVDRYRNTAPVGSYAPNGFGLYDMAGNVWEWCEDWYLPDYYANSADKNPHGPTTSFDPNEPGVMKRVSRGGSYLCADSYSTGYQPASRMKTTPDTSLSHTGFRCVLDAPPTR